MGAHFQADCYADAATAAAAQCTASYPAIRVNADGNHVAEACAVIDSGHLSLTQTVAETEAVATVSVPVSFSSCDADEHYTDLGVIWGLGALLLASLWAMRASLERFWSNA